MGDVSLETVATFFLGQGFFNIGNHERAVEFLGRNEALLQGDLANKRHGLTGLPAVLSHSWLAWSHCELGRFADATDHANKALSIAEDVNQPYSIATACLAIGQVQLVQGGPTPATPMLERALEVCETWGLDVIFPMAAELLGLVHAFKGDVERSLELLQKAEAKSTSSRIFDTPVSAAALGTVYMLAKRTEEAAEFASHALELTIQRGFRGSEARILHLTGEIAALQEAPDYASAEKYYRKAQSLAEECGMRPLVADCHFGLGRLHRQNGKQQQANEHCTTAAAMFQEMEMLRQIERVSDAKSVAGS
jgi:tetratricopeptide (TPR) repeat protein